MEILSIEKKNSFLLPVAVAAVAVTPYCNVNAKEERSSLTTVFPCKRDICTNFIMPRGSNGIRA